ncbi:hypothetical protein SAMN02745114_01375 [Eubacterium coprostanoligenes]|uniref:Uncharacterized protein n=1 Tax=Eubacterium coprostanoligenes TaxID=290054 RepID=A0A1T4MUM6_9FIRM|nr:hypothetical protein SAMN02745114_01375 [Eubacterium coprostanoligenes]
MLTVGFKKCCKYRTYSIFGVFRFLRTSGTIVQQSSQENEIQKLSQLHTACRKYFFRHAKTPEAYLLRELICYWRASGALAAVLSVRVAVRVLTLPSPRIFAHFFNASFSLPAKFLECLGWVAVTSCNVAGSARLD